MKVSASVQQITQNEIFDKEIFDVLAVEVKEAPDKLAPKISYPAGTNILQQGHFPNSVFFISEGIVKHMRVGMNGQEVIINLGYSGQFLGGASVILQRTLPVTIVTVSTCQLSRIAADDFLKLLKTDNRISNYLQWVLSLENHEHILRVSHLACLSAEERLEKLLSHLASILSTEKRDGEVRLQLPLKQIEIAELIAVTPEHLCTVLKRMQEKGTIRKEKGWITISDPNVLSHAASC